MKIYLPFSSFSFTGFSLRLTFSCPYFSILNDSLQKRKKRMMQK